MNNDVYNKFWQHVTNINLIYAGLSHLSNDEFRERSFELQSYIRKTKSEDVLDEKMEECFALVKETARRFSLGDIRVKANELDKKNAHKYDFITIEGDDAIYHHNWIAGGVAVSWDMVHYDTQILSGILLHKQYAAEMATGEGKTLAVTMPAFLNAICHKGVHVQTANDYLSKRDCELTRPLYIFHGLTVDCIEYYVHDKREKKKAYAADIVFGSNNTFVFDYLYDNLAHNTDEIVQRGHHYCIIDELDSILIDRACTPYIVEGNIRADSFKSIFEKIKPAIEELISCENSSEFLQVDSNNGQILISQEAIERFNKSLETEKLFQISQEEQSSQDAETRKKVDERIKLSNAIITMLKAYLIMKKDVHYIIDRNQIIIINPDTGRLDYNSRWENGLHSAVEIKEGVPCKEGHLPEGMIALGNYLKLYRKVSGMSGTLSSVSKELEEVYGIHFAKVPTVKPSIRTDHPIKIYKTISQKYDALIELIKKIHQSHCPILVSCISTKESDLIYDMLSKESLECKKLNAKNLEKEAYLISHAGDFDSIMITTAIAGRGTDIKLSEKSVKAGGLVVVSTSLFDSSRIDNQLKGRAGRQGDPGETYFLVSLEDVIIQNLNTKDKDILNNLAKTDSLNNSEAERIVILSQELREEALRNARDFIRQKDDLFSKYRNRFYKARNGILRRPETCYLRIKDSANNYNVETDYHLHIENLYKQVCVILRNAHNNHENGTVGILFSAEQYLYNIYFNIEKTLADKEYFTHKYVQQIALNRYDAYWSYIIQWLQKQTTINEHSLSQIYSSVKKELGRNILILLFKSCIPVNDTQEEDQNTKTNSMAKREWTKLSRDHVVVQHNAPCPCGSGRCYSDCHGKRWNYIKLL